MKRRLPFFNETSSEWRQSRMKTGGFRDDCRELSGTFTAGGWRVQYVSLNPTKTQKEKKNSLVYLVWGCKHRLRIYGSVRNNKCRLEPEEFNQRRGSNQREPLSFIIPNGPLLTRREKIKKELSFHFLSVVHFSSSSCSVFFLLVHSHSFFLKSKRSTVLLGQTMCKHIYT